MPRGYRSTFVAIGLIALAFSGQSQEQQEQPEREADQEQRAAQVSPFPIPVEIIESQSAAETRERHEAEARQREIKDLAAQQGMNAATQAMNDATQRMAKYSLWTTLLVGIGTALLIWTLIETRRANRAAVAAVNVTRDIGERQLRAYVLFVGINVEKFTRGQVPTLKIIIKNSGQTPAHLEKFVWGIEMVADPDQSPLRRISREDTSKSIGSMSNYGEYEQEIDITLPEWKFDQIVRGEKFLIFYGYVRYRDIFGRLRRTLVRTKLHGVKAAGGVGRFDRCAKHNRAT